MSRNNSYTKSPSRDPIDELYDMINVQNKSFLLQNDFIDFFESKDFPPGVDTIDTAKYYNFVGGNPSRVTRSSFREGYEKELARLEEELTLLRERIELEETIMGEIERTTLDHSGILLGGDGGDVANLFLSVLKIRKLNYRLDPDSRLTIMIEHGDINLSTEPVYYVSGFALWPNERFILPIYNRKQDPVFSVYTVSKEDELFLLGSFSVKLASLTDQGIHKRYYRVLNNENRVVCEVLLNLLYVHNQTQYEDSKRERRRDTYRNTSKRNNYLVKVIEDKLNRLTHARRYQLFEELFSKEIELPPNFLSPKNVQSPRFNVKLDQIENGDYLSEAPSIYDEENQIRVFLTSADEEKIVFQRYIGEHESPNASEFIDTSTSKFDFPVTNSPDYMKMSMFDMPLSELEYLKPPSVTHKRARTLHTKPLSTRNSKKKASDAYYDFGNEGQSLLGFSSLSEIEVQGYNSNEKEREKTGSAKPSPLYQLNISEIKSSKPTAKQSLPGPRHSYMKKEERYPSIVAEESASLIKSEPKTNLPSRLFDRTSRDVNKENFFEDAFLIGLSELMRRYASK